MISNFIDWMLDSAYEFKRLVKILAKWREEDFEESCKKVDLRGGDCWDPRD